MNNIVTLYSIILLIGVFFGSVSQVLLKKSALRKYDSHIKEYCNTYVIGAYSMLAGTLIISTIAYRVLPLSMGPVIETSGYIFVAIFCKRLFHENINRKRMMAIFVIIVGIIIYTICG